MRLVPYHVSTGEQLPKRIILISYHFPPSGAAGSLRWQKLTRLIANTAHLGVDAVALDPSYLKEPDPERFGDLAPGTRAFGVADPDSWPDQLETFAYRLYRRFFGGSGQNRSKGGAPGNGASADGDSTPRAAIRWNLGSIVGWRRAFLVWSGIVRERAWAAAAAETALAIYQPGTHCAIVSCGPPHFVHHAGRSVAKATGLPLVIDMRDPWSLQQRMQEWFATPLWFRIADHYERMAVGQARLVAMNTPAAARAMRAAYPSARVIAAPNGCDEEPLTPPARSGPFTISYAGAIYLDRDPRPVFAGAAKVIERLGLTPDQFRIDMIGTGGGYGGSSLEDLAAQSGIRDHLTVIGTLRRAELMTRLAKSAVLVSLPQDSSLAIPSKVYEWLRFPAWLLALAEPGSATAELLSIVGVPTFATADVDGIANALQQWYDRYQRGERPEPLAIDERLSRRQLAGDLIRSLAELRDFSK